MERLLVPLALWPLWLLRRAMSADHRVYRLLGLAALQPLLESIGRLRARAVYHKARKRCPAYRRFLAAAGHRPGPRFALESLPLMTKESYIRRHGIEERCYDGVLPARGVVIDESSGSSGTPNNWVRSAEERADIRRILQLNYAMIYRGRGTILLNCFALGPWATGMNVSTSLVDVGILKSIGPDRRKLESSLELFGPRYRYLVFAYPPFAKTFVDATALDLRPYHLDLIVGGEGISEGLRDHLLRAFRSVVSSYGASDLEINLGIETRFTISLRRRLAADPELARALFGRPAPPMIFQYNAIDYVIETNAEGEILFTIGRTASAAPKIRYNLRDLGGTVTMRELLRRLRALGVPGEDLAAASGHFPVLWVHGRADLSVPFYGAKIQPSDLEAALFRHPDLVRAVSSFRLESYEDERIDRRLRIHLETVPGFRGGLPSAADLRDRIFDGLAAVNQDFREVTRMFSRDAIEVVLHAHGEGPFRDRDIRVKNRYVEAAPAQPGGGAEKG